MVSSMPGPLQYSLPCPLALLTALLASFLGPLMIVALTLVRRETADFGSTMVGGRMPAAVPMKLSISGNSHMAK